ncbi:MAG: lactonase family protein [Croceitalea sp.]|nr:lactonase family protein [Croceitalea sp.]
MKNTLLISSLMLLLLGCNQKTKENTMQTLFVGTYTDGESEGIYRLNFDSTTGELSNQELAATITNPSFLAISENGQNVYAVQETADFDSLGGGVSAFNLNEGMLELQNSLGTHGAHPCHVSLSHDGQLAVSNYTGGNLAIFKLKTDGSLQANPQLIDHKVLGTTEASHVHKAEFTESGLLVADLGLDAIKRYESKNGQWQPAGQQSLNLPQGAGPRHFVEGQNGRFLYVINELNATITVFEQNEKGNYDGIQTQSSLPIDFKGESFCADIHLSADGKFLYGSNRGHNSLVIFKVDKSSGKIELIGHESVRGDWPRNFTIDATGNYILVANQRSNNITVFKRDIEKGTLSYLNEFKIPSPVCLVFIIEND